METVTVERVVAAPVAEVFGWLSDASNYTRSRLVLRQRLAQAGEDAPYGLGAIRELTWAFGWFRERITAYDPPHEFHYLVERGLPPVHHEDGRMTFTEVPGGTHVNWTTTVQMRMPVAAAAVTRLLGRRVIIFGFDKILDAARSALTSTSIDHGQRSGDT
jgi:uncharacterized protein YndB with AHSA1/START domain